MKYLITLFTLLFFSFKLISGQERPWQGASVEFTHGKLKVSDNRHFLIFEDGTPLDRKSVV
jgi:hypothetical protein